MDESDFTPDSEQQTRALPPEKWCKATAGDSVLTTYTTPAAAYAPEDLIERQRQKFEHQLNRAMADPTQAVVGDGPDCIIGFDTEYVSAALDGSRDRQVLSGQFFLLGECGHLSHIHYPEEGKRFSLVEQVIRLLQMALERRIILEWPRRVTIGGYFLRADLDSITEFHEIKHHLDSAGGRICTMGGGLSFAFLPEGLSTSPETDQSGNDPDAIGAAPRRRSVAFRDDNKLRVLTLEFCDIAGFVGIGKSLADAGDQIGIPKVELPPEYDKACMDVLLERDPELFARYASVDAEITAKFMAETMALAKELTGSSELPPTPSSFAQRLFLKTLKAAGLSREECFGVEKIRTAEWSERADRVRTVTKEVAVPGRENHRAFVTKCYHGGMNMAMHVGPSAIDDWYDWDLSAAYPTVMASIRLIDFNTPRVSLDIADYMDDVVGFAYVEFEYPDAVRQPGLPVDGGNRGLLYPRRGLSYCTAAELGEAARGGCALKIHHGVIFPWRRVAPGEDPIYIFGAFVRLTRALRAKYPAGSVKERQIKLIMNTLYGRLVMGLFTKMVFDTHSGESVPLPPCAITNEVLAAHVTGNIRATLVEILNNLPAGKTALSVTTDGFVCNCSHDELPLDGVMAQRYKAWSVLATGKPKLLELKHRVRQVLVMKTRGQATAEYDATVEADKQTLLARVSVCPPREVPKAEHNEYMVELYLRRQPGDKTVIRPFVSIRDQWSSDSGFVRLERPQLLNLEPDFKNRLTNPRMVRIRGEEHIAFDTVPWDTAEQGLDARAIFDGWREKNCLKTLADWNSWLEVYQLGIARMSKRRSGKSGIGLHNTAEGAVGVLRRMFLRAWAQEKLGLSKTMSGPKLAKWMTSIGLKTTATDVKNAGRATHRFEEGVVPRTKEVRHYIGVLQAAFPKAALDRLLLPAELVPSDVAPF